MKVIIAGSRTITNYTLIAQAIKLSNFQISEIVSGTARGVDRLGERYAKEHKIPIKQFPADWDKWGKQAGYIRNQAMARYADALIAIWDGSSKGTKHMVKEMRLSSKPIFLVVYDDGTLKCYRKFTEKAKLVTT